MIGFVLALPLGAIILAMGAVTSTLTISMGAFISGMVVYSTAFLAFWMFILS